MIKPCRFENCINYKKAKYILSGGKEVLYMVSPCLMCINMKRTNQLELDTEKNNWG